MVKSATRTTTTRTTGTTRLLTTVIQWGWSWRMRFSPGRSLLMAGYCPLLERIEQHDQRARGEVRAVGDRSLQRAVSDREDDHADHGQERAVEERGERVRPAQQKAHEDRQLDVAEAQRLRL